MHAFLLEFGVSLPKGKAVIRRLTNVLEENELPENLVRLLLRLHDHFVYLDEQIKDIEKILENELKSNDASKLLLTILGIGPITASLLLNQWEKLRRVVDDGRLSIDNNRAERSVRPFTVGRNNWLFSNTHNGARASAVLYSLIETAKANDCEPYEYLECVLREIPKLKCGDDHRHLIPWNMPQTEPPSS